MTHARFSLTTLGHHVGGDQPQPLHAPRWRLPRPPPPHPGPRVRPGMSAPARLPLTDHNGCEFQPLPLNNYCSPPGAPLRHSRSQLHLGVARPAVGPARGSQAGDRPPIEGRPPPDQQRRPAPAPPLLPPAPCHLRRAVPWGGADQGGRAALAAPVPAASTRTAAVCLGRAAPQAPLPRHGAVRALRKSEGVEELFIGWVPYARSRKGKTAHGPNFNRWLLMPRAVCFLLFVVSPGGGFAFQTLFLA